jgi:hypothetical protein
VAITPRFLCLCIAILLFAVAAFWTPPSTRPFNLVAAGLGFVALALLL